MDLLSTTHPKAKKLHKCNFCGEKIQIGETYEYQAIKGDHFYVWRCHLKCSELSVKLKMSEHCDEGITEDDFYESVCNEYENIADPDAITKPTWIDKLNFVCNYHKI